RSRSSQNKAVQPFSVSILCGSNCIVCNHRILVCYFSDCCATLYYFMDYFCKSCEKIPIQGSCFLFSFVRFVLYLYAISVIFNQSVQKIKIVKWHKNQQMKSQRLYRMPSKEIKQLLQLYWIFTGLKYIILF